MISVIICSQSPSLSESLQSNIQNTIGAQFETVYIYNQNNRYSLFEAYNIGVKRAKGDILCFMHNDIEYLSKDWGCSVNNVFQDDSIAACAIAGAKYLRRCPSFYPIGGKYNAINLIQQKNGGGVL